MDDEIDNFRHALNFCANIPMNVWDDFQLAKNIVLDIIWNQPTLIGA